MILFVNDNTGILFLARSTGEAIVKYISGTINTFSTTVGHLVHFGRIGGTANGSSAVSGKVVGFGFLNGLINGSSVVTGSRLFGTGRMRGVVNTFSEVTGRMRGYAYISGVINTFSRVTGGINTFLIVEYLRLKSKVTRVLKFKSKL